MYSRNVLHFEQIPRRQRAEHLVPTIRRCSKRFKAQVTAADTTGMAATSKQAWDALTQLFEVLRNEQDQGRLSAPFMTIQTSFIVNGITASEQASMIAARRIDRSHGNYAPLSLRGTLNKIAHHNTNSVTYRIDGRGAHYLILGGHFKGANWVAEILVSRLCKHAGAAVNAIQ